MSEPGPPPPPGGPWGTPPPGTWSAPPSGQPGAPDPGAWGQPAAQPYQYGHGPQSGVELAAPGRRIAARLIDWLIMVAVVVPLYVLVVVAAGLGGSSDEFGAGTASTGVALGGMFLILAIVTVGQVLYEVGFVAIKGATPGKMLMRVRVVREADHQVPGWGPAFLRWVPNLASLVPCVGGLISLGLWTWALVNLFNHPKRQTPFDLTASTIVISTD